VKQSGQLNRKNNLQLFNKGIRIFVLIVYLLYIVSVPTLAVHAGVTVQVDDNQPVNDRAVGFYSYLPLIMGGSGTLPEDIILSNNEIEENLPADTVVGTLMTIDPGAGDTFTYSLVTGAGDDDNDSFNISGDQLRSSEMFNYEEKNSYSIRIQTMDQVGLKYQESFTIDVLDVDDPPVADDQMVSTVQNEQVSITLTGSDEDGDPMTYLLLSLPDYGTLYEDDEPLQIVTIPQPGGSVRVSTDLVYVPDDEFTGVDGFTFQIFANDVLSNVATVTINVNDVTAPTINITGATADGDPMAGDLVTGYILETTNVPEIDHLVQFAETSATDELLADEYFGLTLVAAETTVSAADLIAYYEARGIPAEYLTYLTGAANGTNPFVFIKGHPDLSVTLVDGAKHIVGEYDEDMTVPDDFPLGTYTVEGQIEDEAGNPTTVTLILIVTGDREAPELTITGATADGDPMAGDLVTGYILETTNVPEIDHLIQFADGTDTNEPLGDDYFGLYLVDSTVSAEDLKAYYVAHGTPSVPIDFLGYLQDAADGLNPFVYIKGSTVRLVDAAKWDLLTETHDMTVPDDFPLGTYTVEGQIEDEAGNPTTVTLILIVEDATPPTLEEVTPPEGDFVVSTSGNFVWVVDAADARGNLYELEVDHSMESNPATPEFSVYASETDPYGGEGALFSAAGVTVTYSAAEEKWTIDFGESITNLFIANGGITFYVVLKDDAGNVWGSMDPTTASNTFVYTIPAATMESTDEYEVYQGVVYKHYQMMYMSSQIPLSDTNLLSLWVKEPGDVDYTSIPLDDESLLWFDVENPAGTYEYIAVTLAGEVYSASLVWPEQQTASFEPTGNIGESDGIFYQEYVLMDGETLISLIGEDLEIFAQKIGDAWILMSGPNLGETLWFSMDKPAGTYEYLVVTQSDVVYLATLVLEEDVIDPVLDAVTPAEGEVVLGDGEHFVLTIDGSDKHLFELEIDHSMASNPATPEFSVYANDDDPYGGQYAQFFAAGVTVTYVASEQKWTIDFGQSITDLFIANGGITFYVVLKDYAGNSWGSMSPPTDDNTFVYTITQAGI